MTRYEAFRVLIRAINEKLARTEHKPTRRRLNAAKNFYINDPAWRYDFKSASVVLAVDLSWSTPKEVDLAVLVAPLENHGGTK